MFGFHPASYAFNWAFLKDVVMLTTTTNLLDSFAPVSLKNLRKVCILNDIEIPHDSVDKLYGVHLNEIISYF